MISPRGLFLLLVVFLIVIEQQNAARAQNFPGLDQFFRDLAGQPRSQRVPRHVREEIDREIERTKNIQRALADLGLYSGPIDGDYGPGTRNAVSAYQRQIGERPSGFLSTGGAQQLLAGQDGDRGISAGSAPVAPAAVAAPSPDTLYDHDGGLQWRNETYRLQWEITRRIVKRFPDLVSSERTLRQLLSERSQMVGPEGASIKALARQASEGTEFEQEKALSAFRELISSEATDEPLVITRVRPVTLMRFDRDTQSFPLGDIKQREQLVENYSVRAVGPFALTISLAAWTLPDGYPMAQEDAEAFVQSLKGKRLLEVAIQHRVDPASFEWRDGELWAKGELVSATLHRLRNDRAVALGPVVTSLSASAAPPEVGRQVAVQGIESWRRLGFAVADDRILLHRTTEDASRKANFFFSIVRNDSGGSDIAYIYEAARSTLPPGDFRALFPRTTQPALDAINNDIFLRKEIIDRFNTEYVPRVKALTPKFPVRARLVASTALGRYDFNRKVFPIGNEREGRGTLIQWSSHTLAAEMNLGDIPTELAMPESEARNLLARLRQLNGDRGGSTLYFGVDLDLTGVRISQVPAADGFGRIYDTMRVSQSTATLTTTVTRVGLYADPELRVLIKDFTPPASPPSSNVASPAGPPLGTPVPEATPLGSWGLFALAGRNGGNPAYFDRVLSQTDPVSQANEFGKADALRRVRSIAEAALPPQGQPLLLNAKIRLGDHDLKTGFAVADVTLLTNDVNVQPRLPSGSIALRITNPEALRLLPFDVEAGRNLVAENRSREFAALVSIAPRGVEERAGSGTPVITLSVEVLEVLLLNPKDPSRFIAKLTPSSSGQIPAPAPGANDNAPGIAARPAQAPAAPSAPPVGPGDGPASAAGRPQFDVLGIRIGMPFAEAEEIIRRHMKVGMRLSFRTTQNSSVPIAFGHGLIFVREDKREFIYLVDQPEFQNDVAIAVGRLSLEKYEEAPLVNALRGKYQLSEHTSGTFGRHYRSGGSPARPATHDSCHLMLGTIGLLQVQNGEGAIIDPATLLPDDVRANGINSPFNFPWAMFHPDILRDLNNAAACVPAASAWVSANSGIASGFAVWVVDPSRYATLIIEGQRKALREQNERAAAPKL